MTGRAGHQTMEMNGGSTASYPRVHPSRPLVYTWFNRFVTKKGRLPGATWDRFCCTVKSSPVIFGVENSEQKRDYVNLAFSLRKERVNERLQKAENSM